MWISVFTSYKKFTMWLFIHGHKKQNWNKDYKVFKWLRDLKQSFDQRALWLYGLGPLIGSHSPVKFGDRPCRSGDITFLNCHMATYDHVIQGSYDLVVGVPPWSHQPAKNSDYNSCESGKIIFKIFHVTSRLSRNMSYVIRSMSNVICHHAVCPLS